MNKNDLFNKNKVLFCKNIVITESVISKNPVCTSVIKFKLN